MNNKNLHSQETQQTSNRIKSKTILRYILLKLLKNKDMKKVLKTARRKQNIVYEERGLNVCRLIIRNHECQRTERHYEYDAKETYNK